MTASFRTEGAACLRPAFYSLIKQNSGYPTRVHGSVSICPVAGADGWYEVKTGMCLNRNRLADWQGLIRSRSVIIEFMRGSFMVTIATMNVLAPKWDWYVRRSMIVR